METDEIILLVIVGSLLCMLSFGIKSCTDDDTFLRNKKCYEQFHDVELCKSFQK